MGRVPLEIGKGDALWSRTGGMPTLDRQRLRDGMCADATT
jgi:hypothetical protein